MNDQANEGRKEAYHYQIMNKNNLNFWCIKERSISSFILRLFNLVYSCKRKKEFILLGLTERILEFLRIAI